MLEHGAEALELGGERAEAGWDDGVDDDLRHAAHEVERHASVDVHLRAVVEVLGSGIGGEQHALERGPGVFQREVGVPSR